MKRDDWLPTNVSVLFYSVTKTTIFIAALSEYGMQTVDWLITRGAVKIILQSQYKPVTGYQFLTLQRWKNSNVDVILSNTDVSTLTGAENLIKVAASLGPVGGIFHIGHVSSTQFLGAYRWGRYRGSLAWNFGKPGTCRQIRNFIYLTAFLENWPGQAPSLGSRTSPRETHFALWLIHNPNEF